MFERRSLPNLGPHARSVAFNSQRPYPQRADFEGSGGEVRDDERRRGLCRCREGRDALTLYMVHGIS